MPPRYAYWTILIDDQPTAFRATKVEELLPTFNRLKQKNPSAVMMWSQFGKLWKSPEEAMAEGKSKDPRQSARPKPEWKPKAAGGERPYTRKPYADRPKPPAFARGSHLRQGSGGQVGAAGQAPGRKPSPDRPKLEWKPKGTFTPAERGHSKPEWKPREERSAKPAWKPRPQSSSPKPPAFAKGSHLRQGSGGQVGAAGQALSPKPSRPRRVPPKPGSKNWRPGGDHQDPRQKYLDAKKAKWTRFKKAIRDRHEKKSKP